MMLALEQSDIFSSYDIITKLPYWVTFITLFVGVLQIGYPNIGSAKEISISLIVVSIASLFLNFFNSEKIKYDEIGVTLTQQFKQLRMLYFKVKTYGEDRLWIGNSRNGRSNVNIL